ncbi:MAG: cytochrome C biogenesis protein CcsA [Rhodocyclaceae bacterium]|nr:cytochrome C biogenesis protein CcsA [Rhodocyclaceae bacterium]
MHDSFDEKRHMRKTSVCVLSFLAMLLAPAWTALASAELAGAKYCMNCHGFGGRIVGPGYREIAARRAGEPNADELLARRIRDGSNGEWGTVAMPANAVSAEDALVLARRILSLAPSR